MCDSGGGDEKKRYFFGPFEDPDDPRSLMTLEAAVETLREYFEDMDEGEEIHFKLVMLTDKEVEALPDL